MEKHVLGRKPSRRSPALRGLVFAAAGIAQLIIPAALHAGDIGVLSDGRQEAYLSLLGSSSGPARVALQQDGHTINILPSLNPAAMELVDVVWLPLLETDQAYTSQERIWLADYVATGGRLVWIGDADVYNSGDDSFLAVFGTGKLIGNLNAGLAPTAAYAGHPAVTGPHGAVSLVGTNVGYGLFGEAAGIDPVFVGANSESPPQSGVFAGFINSDSGYAGSGRAVLICDASVFGQNLDQPGQGHRALLRNIIRWAIASPGYTPSGTQVSTGDLAGACPACSAVRLVFASVTATGETTVAPVGSGRCGFTGIPQSAVPWGFIGYGFAVTTSAVLPDSPSVNVQVAYADEELASLGIGEAALRLFYCPATGAAVDITGNLDTAANAIDGTAGGVGRFLLGAIIPAPDCNANGIPDECDIDPADPDGNGTVSRDCNQNGIPDECEISAGSTAPGGPFFCMLDCAPDCNSNGIPDACDLDATDPDGNGSTSADCNTNSIPDECESGLAPSIVQQPVGRTVCAGQAATFTVAADGFGLLEYHWRKNLVELPEATQSTLTIDPATPDDGGSYDVVVNGPCGAIASTSVTLTVSTGPAISQQPAQQDVCPGGAAQFIVVATGTGPLTYQWQRDGTPLVDDGVVSGAAGATLHIEPVTLEHAGQYTCRLTDSCGNTFSTAALLNVGAAAEITTQPLDRSVCPGDSPTFTITATGAQLAYQWQLDGGAGFQNLVDGEGLGGATTTTLTLSAVTAAATGSYRCVVTGACGAPATSTAASLFVGVPVTVETGPADRFACPGDSVPFEVVAAGTTLSYEWHFNPGSGYIVLQDGDGISGAHAATLTIATAMSTHAGLYRCIVSGMCGLPVTTSSATLTIGTFPNILTNPADQFACPGDNVSLRVVASGSNHTYQWEHDAGDGFVDVTDGPGIAGATSATLALQDVAAALAGPYRCVISGDCGTPVPSAVALLTVGAAAAIAVPPEGRTVCPGTQTAFSVVATGSGLTYRWQFNGGAAFENLTDGNGISGATTATLLIAAADQGRAGQYRCIVYGTCGSPAMSSAATLVVTVDVCDCNGNEIADEDDIASGTSLDCNANNIPDECDLDPADPDGNGLISHDCNGNGLPDECDIAAGTSLDCNQNGVPDECDLAAGTSHDCNNDGVPDDCQLAGNDCNGNGIPDECDPPYVAEAGEPLVACAGAASAPLGGDPVAGGSNSPYTYSWQIVSGPAGGTIFEPNTEHPRFAAGTDGVYEVGLVVTDSSRPPCVTTDSVQITVVSLSVEAGEPFALCTGSTSAPLAPAVTGGVGPYSYSWSIDSGSPNTSPDQFTGGGPFVAGPTFSPSQPGYYTLRLTVEDANSPTCAATDTVVVHSVQMVLAPPADFAMCSGGQSAPLHVQIVQQGTQPLAHAWSIEPGSPSLALSQFTGSGPSSASPTFSPAATGAYVLRATVLDSSTPPCGQSVTFQVHVGTLAVDAGSPRTECVGGGGVRMAPAIVGGAGTLGYAWSIEPGSPSTAITQFTDPHNFALAPRFVPALPGDYTLRLTVMDSATPACVSSDTVVVHATQITVDAGQDFTTQAFQPSPPLGAVPMVAGEGPLACEWRIISGPSLDAAQLSAANVEHPTFTPAAAGVYQLGVTATPSGGAACSASDAVVINAIAPALTLPVNVEGRLFMTLQLDAAYARAEVRVSGAAPGTHVTGQLRDDGSAANMAGLLSSPRLTRRLSLASGSRPSSLLVVVAMYYDDTRLNGASEQPLRIHRLNTGRQVWQPAGTASAELGPPPPRPGREDSGRNGVDVTNNCVWVVVDYWGEFAMGITSDEPSPDDPPNPDDPSGTSDGSSPSPPAGSTEQLSPSACGAAGPCGTGTLAPLALVFTARLARRRPRPPSFSRDS